MVNDFSIREEIRVELEENLNLKDITIDEVLDDLLLNEDFLNSITISIYKSIISILKEKNNNNVENVEEELYNLINYSRREFF